mmetsp:Transcript_28205/g.90904  ORF Transcript_28205/g.90904 Transcript_28205/m.90904 type:complete len:289 (-) Transcript_28205:53-919(-)
MSSSSSSSAEWKLVVTSVVTVVVSAASYWVALRWPLHEGGRELKAAERTLSRRLEAMDRICLLPYSVAIAASAAWSSWEPAFAADPRVRWYASSPLMLWCLSLYVSKTAFDSVVQIATWRRADRKRAEILAHHLVSVVAIGYGLLVSRQCYFWGALAAVTEGTTVFLNNVMATKLFAGERTPKQKAFVAANGVLLWLSYLLCRLALLPFWLYRFAADLRSFDVSDVSLFQLTFYPLSVLAILLLSCYWFFLITRGVVKALRGAGGATAPARGGGNNIKKKTEKSKKVS